MQGITKVPFECGTIVMTKNVQNTIPAEDILDAIKRHIGCDWGELSDADWEKNNSAVVNNNARIVSAYRDCNDEKFWIITEADRSATTVLLPSDY